MEESLLSSRKSSDGGDDSTVDVETSRMAPSARSLLSSTFQQLHGVRRSHASATAALLVGQIIMYMAIFLPLATTTSLERLEAFGGMACTTEGAIGATSTFYTHCHDLAKDEVYVQNEMGIAERFRFHCVTHNGTVVPGQPGDRSASHVVYVLDVMQRMMAQENSLLFTFLPFLKTIDTFLVVFFLKSALSILLSHGIYGLAICMSYRPAVTKRQIVTRSKLPYAYLVFVVIALGIYAFAYLLMVTEPDDVCVLDRRVDFSMCASTIPGLIVSVAGLAVHLVAQRRLAPTMLRELYLFDAMRPYRWFHVLCKAQYDEASAFGHEMKSS